MAFVQRAKGAPEELGAGAYVQQGGGAEMKWDQ